MIQLLISILLLILILYKVFEKEIKEVYYNPGWYSFEK